MCGGRTEACQSRCAARCGGDEEVDIRRLAAACALCVLAMAELSSSAAKATPPVGVDESCVAPAGDPAPGSVAWQQRDAINQYCATLRVRDQVLSPAFGFGNLTEGASLWVAQFQQQLGEPGHLHGGVTTLVPGSQAADPFRTIQRWSDAGRGRVSPVRFTALDGAQLRGHVFAPPESLPRPAGGYPGVVITDGSIQAFENLYFWAAEDLAESGYLVMTYDVQGQGDSDLLPKGCPDPANPAAACPGVPYQQNYNFFQGAEDSLSFFLSTPAHPFGGSSNPYFADLDPSRVGIAGHSLGAAAVSEVGQCDTRVRTIVAWDDLSAITGCGDVTVPRQYRSATLLHAPALALTNDYFFNPQPMTAPPDPHSKDAGYRQVAAAGLDTEMIALRGATHLTYTYVPLLLPASELAERMASYYTLAWFDLELRGDATGFTRLVATHFDSSVDVHSIGAGVYDPAAASPTDPYSGNVPYTIDGIRVADAVSFYYESEYSLRSPGSRHVATCVDVRAGCPAQAPPTP